MYKQIKSFGGSYQNWLQILMLGTDVRAFIAGDWEKLKLVYQLYLVGLTCSLSSEDKCMKENGFLAVNQFLRIKCAPSLFSETWLA